MSKTTEWRKNNPEKSAATIEAYKERQRIANAIYLSSDKAKEKRAIQYENYKKRRAGLRSNRKELLKEKARQWRLDNPEKAKSSVALWAKTNPHKVNSIHNKRRATKISATPAWANAFFIEEIYDLAQRRTKATGFKWHVDHTVPLQSKVVCGLHVHNNLQVIPAVENYSKGNRHWPDMPCATGDRAELDETVDRILGFAS